MIGYVDGKCKEINFKKISWELSLRAPEMVNPWKETLLPTLLLNYGLKDIYNTDEFVLFCKYMTNKTCQLKSEKCVAGKVKQSSHKWHGSSEFCWG